jgi:RND family efflux transporter MFP subunit
MTRHWILGLSLLASACSGAGETDNAAEPIALVRLAPATQGASAQQITLYGAAESGPSGRLALVSPAEAKVVAIDAPVGTPTKAGQVVVRLAASPTMRAEAARAASDASAASKALARAMRLRADGLMSDADVETARAAAASAGALRASFDARAGDLTLRAAAAGVVDNVAVAPGELLQPGAAVASITRMGDVRVRFGVDADTARSIRLGMTLRIAGAGGRPPVSIAVESISPVVDPQTRLASVFGRAPAGSGIVAGQTLTAVIDIDRGPGLSIPYSALLDDAGQSYVYVVAGSVAHRRDVVTQPASGDRVTILKGVRPGDQVVVEGGTALEDGMKVRTK